MKRTITLAAAALTVAGLTACVPIEDEAAGTTTVSSWSYSPPSFTAPKTTVPVKPDPYRTTGTWLVPGEIAPGTYRVDLQPGKRGGYSKTCADYTCEIGTPGFIANELYSGRGILVIPETAVSVELSRIVLTPMAGA